MIAIETPTAGGLAAATWMSPNEAGRTVGVSGETIRREIRAGRLPAVRLGRRLFKISADALGRWVEGSVAGPAKG